MPNIYKVGSRWYIFASERDYPHKKLVKQGFASRKKASQYIIEHKGGK